jgi:thiopeptide-type bacteriocin biosynthesis protein
VRYRWAVLAPARWRLTAADLPAPDIADEGWHQALDRWRQRWRCPDLVELHDADRTLRLNLTEPAHLALVHAHLHRHGHAVLSEAAAGGEFGWIGGHAHEVVVPPFSTLPAATPPHVAGRRLTINARHGHLPGSPGAAWLSAKLFAHPERTDGLIAEHVPVFLAGLGGEPACWFVRYRSLETDHLRLRIRISAGGHGQLMAAAGAWAQQLRDVGLIGRLAFDTYYPETGRYGEGAAMAAAEHVFVADSTLVSAQLRHQRATAVHPTALAAINMVHTVQGLLGDPATAMRWLAGRPPATAGPLDRDLVRQVISYAGAHASTHPAGWNPELMHAWQARDEALQSYRPSYRPTRTSTRSSRRCCTCTTTGHSASTAMARRPAGASPGRQRSPGSPSSRSRTRDRRHGGCSGAVISGQAVAARRRTGLAHSGTACSLS